MHTWRPKICMLPVLSSLPWTNILPVAACSEQCSTKPFSYPFLQIESSSLKNNIVTSLYDLRCHTGCLTLFPEKPNLQTLEEKIGLSNNLVKTVGCKGAAEVLQSLPGVLKPPLILEFGVPVSWRRIGITTARTQLEVIFDHETCHSKRSVHHTQACFSLVGLGDQLPYPVFNLFSMHRVIQ